MIRYTSMILSIFIIFGCSMKNLYDRGNGAAAETSHFLQSKELVRIGILAGLDPQFADECLIHSFGPFYMACRTGAYANDMLAYRGMSEL